MQCFLTRVSRNPEFSKNTIKSKKELFFNLQVGNNNILKVDALKKIERH
jgi:hypothetical protein